ncbi:MAG: hypothetical protein M3077_04720 [Candidatus Dormibacteraeota bacterium]|nr:hypothetical protein [Candidatus Dormibacteraeota bacterium]
MGIVEETARLSGRDRGLQAVRGWTWTIGIGSAALTAVLALVAAGSFAGHQAAAAAPPAAATDPGVAVDNSGQTAPQPAPSGSLGGSSQPPAAVSGGS